MGRDLVELEDPRAGLEQASTLLSVPSPSSTLKGQFAGLSGAGLGLLSPDQILLDFQPQKPAPSFSKGVQRPVCYCIPQIQQAPIQFSRHSRWNALPLRGRGSCHCPLPPVPQPLLVSSDAAQNEFGKQKGTRILRSKNEIQAGSENRSQAASSVPTF